MLVSQMAEVDPNPLNLSGMGLEYELPPGILLMIAEEEQKLRAQCTRWVLAVCGDFPEYDPQGVKTFKKRKRAVRALSSLFLTKSKSSDFGTYAYNEEEMVITHRPPGSRVANIAAFLYSYVWAPIGDFGEEEPWDEYESRLHQLGVKRLYFCDALLQHGSKKKWTSILATDSSLGAFESIRKRASHATHCWENYAQGVAVVSDRVSNKPAAVLYNFIVNRCLSEIENYRSRELARRRQQARGDALRLFLSF